MKVYEIKDLESGTELIFRSKLQVHAVQFVRTEQTYTLSGSRRSIVAVVQRKDNGRLVYAEAKHLSRPRPLGEHQQAVLDCLADGRHGAFSAGCGWIYGNYSTTVQILDSLVKRGLVVRIERPIDRPGPRGTYTHVEYRLVK